MSRLGRNVSANILGTVWSTVLSLLFIPVYISLLGLESYGLIGFYSSLIALLGVRIGFSNHLFPYPRRYRRPERRSITRSLVRVHRSEWRFAPRIDPNCVASTRPAPRHRSPGRAGCSAPLQSRSGPRGIRPPETGPAAVLFTNSGSWGNISCVVRRQTGTRERENGPIVRCDAAWGG